ncbi:uncharacterized protein LOC132743027 [Ruditapes philippinarum]|uniref:uncharacterized protein LOC132743027 n=1 Tax=Ruditapes philippinarum TaxID=129788 RepID=UPI00295B74BF|nr:uncharacterized protein LOC132743027 [Ruditapes philippinarum]XP_060587521.1 uncharacterized protein LOC132743027 [Ruditapes philippinarum]
MASVFMTGIYSQVIIFLLVFFSKPVQTRTYSETTDGSDSKTKKSFTITVNNQLRQPKFNKSVVMEIEDENSALIKYMEKAVNQQNGLMEKFTVTYFSGGLGYFIEAINDAKGNWSVDGSFWQIRTELGRANVGISSLIPKDGMKVLLDLIISGPDDKCE